MYHRPLPGTAMPKRPFNRENQAATAGLIAGMLAFMLFAMNIYARQISAVPKPGLVWPAVLFVPSFALTAWVLWNNFANKLARAGATLVVAVAALLLIGFAFPGVVL